MELLQREAGTAAGEVNGKAERKVWPAVQPEAKLDVVTMLRLRDQMKQQLMDYGSAVHTGQENGFYHINEQKFIDSATENLEQDTEEVQISLQNKTLALQRNQLMVALRNKMKQNDHDSRLIMETMKHILKLTSSVLHYQQQAREKEQKLNDIKKKRLLLKKHGRQKLLEIHDMKKKQKEEQVRTSTSEILEKIQDTFKKERELTTVIQNVFQNIIIASGVDWAEDPSLKAIILRLEKNVNIL
ncbi:PREDICTED: centromere protein H [Calidris pugnax]|uniref:centromere protein H n=1 Tax=Calidris pugnax TaxID=198806 RepID=UPI00071DA3DF|nr:PREDICTED: centromere protein H [Calidris pugnax]